MSDSVFAYGFEDSTGQWLFVRTLGQGPSTHVQLVQNVATGAYAVRKVCARRFRVGKPEPPGLHEFINSSVNAYALTTALQLTLGQESNPGTVVTAPFTNYLPLELSTSGQVHGDIWTPASYWAVNNGGTLQEFLINFDNRNLKIPGAVSLGFVADILEALNYFYRGQYTIKGPDDAVHEGLVEDRQAAPVAHVDFNGVPGQEMVPGVLFHGGVTLDNLMLHFPGSQPEEEGPSSASASVANTPRIATPEPPSSPRSQPHPAAVPGDGTVDPRNLTVFQSKARKQTRDANGKFVPRGKKVNPKARLTLETLPRLRFASFSRSQIKPASNIIGSSQTTWDIPQLMDVILALINAEGKWKYKGQYLFVPATHDQLLRETTIAMANQQLAPGDLKWTYHMLHKLDQQFIFNIHNYWQLQQASGSANANGQQNPFDHVPAWVIPDLSEVISTIRTRQAQELPRCVHRGDFTRISTALRNDMAAGHAVIDRDNDHVSIQALKCMCGPYPLNHVSYLANPDYMRPRTEETAHQLFASARDMNVYGPWCPVRLDRNTLAFRGFLQPHRHVGMDEGLFCLCECDVVDGNPENGLAGGSIQPMPTKWYHQDRPVEDQDGFEVAEAARDPAEVAREAEERIAALSRVEVLDLDEEALQRAGRNVLADCSMEM